MFGTAVHYRTLGDYWMPAPRLRGGMFGGHDTECEGCFYPLMRSIAAPQAESLSSSRSKPRSR